MAKRISEPNIIAILANLYRHPPFTYVDVNSEYNVHIKRKIEKYAPIRAA